MLGVLAWVMRQVAVMLAELQHMAVGNGQCR